MSPLIAVIAMLLVLCGALGMWVASLLDQRANLTNFIRKTIGGEE